MANPDIVRLISRMMEEEVTPYLKSVPGVDLKDYKATLLTRFANPAVNDQLLRIGTEGSARIPKFVLPCIQDALANGGAIKFLCFTIASWIYYLGQVNDEKGQPLGFSDPMLEKIKAAAVSGRQNARHVLEISEIFGADLPKNKHFADQVEEILKEFYTAGPTFTLKKYAGSR